MDRKDLAGSPGMLPDDPGHRRVLVVDDDLAQRTLISRVLRRAGYECATAMGAEEARTVLATSAFGLVITDLRMFSEDGLELVRQIADRYANIYTILVTGWTEDGLEQRVRQAGGFALLAKPVDVERLVEVVDAAFEAREKAVALHRHRSL